MRPILRVLLVLAIVCAGAAGPPGAGLASAANPQLERIKEKGEEAKSGVKAHARGGGDPIPMLKLMKQVGPNLQEGDLDGAEMLLDQVLEMLEGDGGEGGAARSAVSEGEPATDLFWNPRRVEIVGYDGDAMEPFISRDGRYLFFNNLNDPRVDTNLHYAERIDAEGTGAVGTDGGRFRYAGEVRGVNSRRLDAVPSMDANNRFYFTTPRKVGVGNSTIFAGDFEGGEVKGADLVPGEMSKRTQGWYVLGGEISPDGGTLYYVQAQRGKSPGPPQSMNLKVAHLRDGRFEVDPGSDEIFKNVNSDALDYAPAISSDGLELFFTRAEALIVGKRPVGRTLRIYMATRTRAGEPFGMPRLITAIEGFIEGPTISGDGMTLYYHKKDGARFTIYKVERRG